jgi:hypothetical protein
MNEKLSTEGDIGHPGLHYAPVSSAVNDRHALHVFIVVNIGVSFGASDFIK